MDLFKLQTYEKKGGAYIKNLNRNYRKKKGGTELYEQLYNKLLEDLQYNDEGDNGDDDNGNILIDDMSTKKNEENIKKIVDFIENCEKGDVKYENVKTILIESQNDFLAKNPHCLFQPV